MAARSLFSHLGRCELQFEKNGLFMFASSLASQFKAKEESSPKSANPTPNLKNKILKLKSPEENATSVLQNWVANGHKVTFSQLRFISQILVNSKRYSLALQIFTWMETRNNFRICPADKATRLELIIKVHGIKEAEEYFKLMPDSPSRKAASLPLLHGYVKEGDTEKAEALMNNMNDSGFLLSPHPFNEIMKLYISTSQYEKVPLVILQMKRNDIPLNTLSYNLWMSSCCEMSELSKVERVYKKMASDKNVEIGWSTLSSLANAYTKANHVDKALWALKMAETKLSADNRLGYSFLITQYCSLRNKQAMKRLWESSKRVSGRTSCANYICVISCFVKVDDLKEAERVFLDWESNCRNYDIRVSNVLLGGYVRKGLIKRAELLYVRTLKRGGNPNFKTWEILMEGWVKGGKMEKAVGAMNRAFSLMEDCDWRPSPGSLMAIAKYLEKKGSFEDANRVVKLFSIAK